MVDGPVVRASCMEYRQAIRAQSWRRPHPFDDSHSFEGCDAVCTPHIPKQLANPQPS